MATPYSKENQSKSDKVHELAQNIIYPKIFNCPKSNLSFITPNNESEEEKYRILDGEMGIDKIVKVTVDGLHGPLEFTFQERWRDAKYSRFRDLTITEFNHATERLSELYKINAGIFLYGYTNTEKDNFIEVVAVDTAKMLLSIAKGELSYTFETNPRSMQDFLGILIDDLAKQDLILYHYKSATT